MALVKAYAEVSPQPQAKVQQRACDQCRFRRTKCSFGQPCTACTRSELPVCSYEDAPRKKGPRGNRIATLQHNQAALVPSNNVVAPQAAKPDNGSDILRELLYGSTFGTGLDDVRVMRVLFPQSTPRDIRWPCQTLELLQIAQTGLPCLSGFSVAGLPSRYGLDPVSTERLADLPSTDEFQPESLPEGLFRQYLDVFFDLVQEVTAVFTREWLDERVTAGLHRRDKTFMALVLSMSSLALIQPGIPARAPDWFSDPLGAGYLLYLQACRILAEGVLRNGPSLYSVFANYFLYAVLHGLGKNQCAFIRLREAITTVECLQLHQPAGYRGLSQEDARAALKAFWVLCINERVLAIHHGRCVVFRGPSSLLQSDTMLMLERVNDKGMLALMRLFDNVSDVIQPCLMQCCNIIVTADTTTSVRQDGVPCRLTQDHVVVSQRNINMDMFCGLSGLPAIRLVDMLITSCWLKAKIWQIALSHSLLVVEAADRPEIELRYIVTVVAQQLRNIMLLFPQATWDASGISMVEKLYDIATSLAVLVHGHVWLGSLIDAETAALAPIMLDELVASILKCKGGVHPYADLARQWTMQPN